MKCTQKKNNSFTLPRILRLILLKFNYQRWNRNSSYPVDHPAPKWFTHHLQWSELAFPAQCGRDSHIYSLPSREPLCKAGAVSQFLSWQKQKHRFSWKDQQIYIFQPSRGTLYGSLNYFLPSIVRKCFRLISPWIVTKFQRLHLSKLDPSCSIEFRFW